MNECKKIDALEYRYIHAAQHIKSYHNHPPIPVIAVHKACLPLIVMFSQTIFVFPSSQMVLHRWMPPENV